MIYKIVRRSKNHATVEGVGVIAGRWRKVRYVSQGMRQVATKILLTGGNSIGLGYDDNGALKAKSSAMNTYLFLT